MELTAKRDDLETLLILVLLCLGSLFFILSAMAGSYLAWELLGEQSVAILSWGSQFAFGLVSVTILLFLVGKMSREPIIRPEFRPLDNKLEGEDPNEFWFLPRARESSQFPTCP